MDVTRLDDANRLRDTLDERFGRLDIAVNSAGVISVQRVEGMSEREWDRVMNVNAKGTFLCCQAAIPLLRRAGTATIVNIASVSGKDGYPDRKSTRLNSSHLGISYAVFCLKKKNLARGLLTLALRI